MSKLTETVCLVAAVAWAIAAFLLIGGALTGGHFVSHPQQIVRVGSINPRERSGNMEKVRLETNGETK